MSVRALFAIIECDECGCEMHFDMDTGMNIPEGWDLADMAEDQCRGGASLRKINGKEAAAGCTSVQDGKSLCPKCTHVFDMASEI